MEGRLKTIFDKIPFAPETKEYFSFFTDDICQSVENFGSGAKNKETLLRFSAKLLPLLQREGLYISKKGVQSMKICGDIHGDLGSLLSFLELCDMERDYIFFLGDYMDKGKYGVQVLFVVFLLKVAMPERVVLLRGNHEGCANMDGMLLYNMVYVTFDGYNVYDEVFGFLPLVCTVNDKIFMVHGCVPRAHRLSRYPSLLANPKEDLVTSLTWGDIDLSEAITNDLCVHGSECTSINYLFLNMSLCGFQLFVRGHNWIPKGFQVLQCMRSKMSNVYLRKRSISINPSAESLFFVSLHTHEDEVKKASPACMSIDTVLGEYRIFQIGKDKDNGDILTYGSDDLEGEEFEDEEEEEEEEKS